MQVVLHKLSQMQLVGNFKQNAMKSVIIKVKLKQDLMLLLQVIDQKINLKISSISLVQFLNKARNNKMLVNQEMDYQICYFILTMHLLNPQQFQLSQQEFMVFQKNCVLIQFLKQLLSFRLKNMKLGLMRFLNVSWRLFQ